ENYRAASSWQTVSIYMHSLWPNLMRGRLAVCQRRSAQQFYRSFYLHTFTVQLLMLVNSYSNKNRNQLTHCQFCYFSLNSLLIACGFFSIDCSLLILNAILSNSSLLNFQPRHFHFF
ncbi:unnamed protein product, partial [Prunus brigantina]